MRRRRSSLNLFSGTSAQSFTSKYEVLSELISVSDVLRFFLRPHGDGIPYSQRVRMDTTGSLRSSGGKIRNPAEAASLLIQLATAAQKNLITIADWSPYLFAHSPVGHSPLTDNHERLSPPFYVGGMGCPTAIAVGINRMAPNLDTLFRRNHRCYVPPR